MLQARRVRGIGLGRAGRLLAQGTCQRVALCARLRSCAQGTWEGVGRSHLLHAAGRHGAGVSVRGRVGAQVLNGGALAGDVAAAAAEGLGEGAWRWWRWGRKVNPGSGRRLARRSAASARTACARQPHPTGASPAAHGSRHNACTQGIPAGLCSEEYRTKRSQAGFLPGPSPPPA